MVCLWHFFLGILAFQRRAVRQLAIAMERMLVSSFVVCPAFGMRHRAWMIFQCTGKMLTFFFNLAFVLAGDLNSTTETGAVEFLLRGHVSSNCMDWPIGGGAVMASTAQQGSTGVRQPSGSSVLSQSGADSPPSTVAALVAGVDRKQLTQDINAYLQIECPAADQNSTSTRANLEPSFKWSEYDQTRVEGNEENLFGYDTKTGRLVKQDVWAQSLRQDLAASSRTTMQTTRVVAKSEWALVHRYSRFAAPLAANVSQRARKIPSLNTIGCKSKLFLLPQLVFHPFQLASAYGYFPWSTHFATDFTGTLDWLLVDDRYFRVQRSLPVPHQSLLDVRDGCRAMCTA